MSLAFEITTAYTWEQVWVEFEFTHMLRGFSKLINKNFNAFYKVIEFDFLKDSMSWIFYVKTYEVKYSFVLQLVYYVAVLQTIHKVKQAEQL